MDALPRLLSTVEIDHDVLAAIIGAFAVVMVAVVPKSVAKAVNRRSELVALRERVDELILAVNASQERRHAEHEELRLLISEAIQPDPPPRRTHSR